MIYVINASFEIRRELVVVSFLNMYFFQNLLTWNRCDAPSMLRAERLWPSFSSYACLTLYDSCLFNTFYSFKYLTTVNLSLFVVGEHIQHLISNSIIPDKTFLLQFSLVYAWFSLKFHHILWFFSDAIASPSTRSVSGSEIIFASRAMRVCFNFILLPKAKRSAFKC